jgi:hypothetical protein
MFSKSGSLVASGFVLALAACSSVAPTRSGFLDNYDSLVAREERLLEAVHLIRGWGEKRFVLEPVEWRAGEQGFSALRIEQLRRGFAEELQRVLATTLVAAGNGERGVLRVRAAITAAEPVAPWRNGLSFAALGLALDNGGAAVEIEVLDPQGDSLLKASYARPGSVFKFWRGFHPATFARKSLRDLAREFGERVRTAVAEAPEAGLEVRP